MSASSSSSRSRSASRRSAAVCINDEDDPQSPVVPAIGSPHLDRQQRQADVRLFMDKSPVELVRDAASYTAPDFSLVFVILFVLLAYFHETHQAYAGIALGVWLTLQLAASLIKEDFRNDLFWGIFSLAGNLLFYLFAGYLWSLAKLYLDVWQGHLSPELMSQIRVCVSDTGKPGCIVSFVLDMKWNIVRWMILWPVSLIHTLSRDPLRILTDIIFEWSRQRYAVIITSALAAYDREHSSDVSSSSAGDWYILAWWFAYVLAYSAIGFIWCHLKLFIDVWQGALPPSLDQEVRDIYVLNQNYWSFALKIKWLVMMWLVTWPFSVVYTTLRHPVRILVEIIYKLSQRKFVWIITKAMNARDQSEKQE